MPSPSETFQELFHLALPTSPAETPAEMLAVLSRKPAAPTDANGGEPAANEAEAIGNGVNTLLVRFGALPHWVLAILVAIYRELADEAVEDILAEALAETEEEGREGDAWQESFPADYVRPQKRTEVPPEDCTPLDPDEVAGMLGPDGPLAKTIPGYEPREAQLTMAKAVADSFNTGKHLLVEAGTGTGKSLAYLLPAAIWAIRNDVAVIVSTNTRNLQTQLIDKDLPLVTSLVNELQAEAGQERMLRTALIKGRSNYLCLRRLESLLEQGVGEMERPRLRQFARALAWAVQTPDGDLDTLDCGAGMDPTMRLDLCSTGEECPGRSCPFFRRCFAMKARAKSLGADIVVANHALVFSEMGGPGVSLPVHSQVIFDEAHNLEEAATDHFSTELSVLQLRMLIRGIVPLRRHRYGVIDSLKKHVEKRTLKWTDEGARAMRSDIRAIRERGEALVSSARKMFDPLPDALPRGEDSARFGTAVDTDFNAEPWRGIIEASQPVKEGLKELGAALHAMAAHLDDMMADELPLLAAESTELKTIADSLEEFRSSIEFVLSASDPEHVFWIEKGHGRSQDASMCAAPLEIGRRLADELYSAKSSVVFCSATLRVGDSFNFLASRLGINLIDKERLATCVAPSPFDYMRQCRVMAPLFLPEPTAARTGTSYTEELAKLIRDTAIRTEGRLLGLFTSYEMMTNCARLLSTPLGDAGIRLLVQGQHGSRDQITRTFREGGACVLLGTHSFWEGVDVVGDALSCVVIARLPFTSPTEPIFQARSEKIDREGNSSFFTLSLPSAVIRFRQGFGRLIRHRNDRGIVIVADSRVSTKGYGARFRQSLPCSTFMEPDRAAMLDHISEFFQV